MNSIEQILWGVCAGLALALIYTFYIKRVQGGHRGLGGQSERARL